MSTKERGWRRFGIGAQTGRVGEAPAGVAANPATGAVGEGAASAVADADEQAVDAVHLDGLRSAGVPTARDLRRVPGSPAPTSSQPPRQVSLVELGAPELGAEAYHTRNRWMVDRSDLVIGFPHGDDPRSGTWYTIHYGADQGRPRLIVPI